MSQQEPQQPLTKTGELALAPDVAVARVRPTRPPQRMPEHHGITQSDILFALFKHKKKIAVGSALGLLAAAGIFLFFPTVYESDARLMVRYLVERSTVDSVNTAKNPDGVASTTDNVIGSEMMILSSWDLAVQTAEAIGPKRLLPSAKGTPTKEAAAGTIAGGLALTSTKGSNIIFAAYRNKNPELTTLVLNELVNRYFNKHLEVHRSAGAFDFVTQQTDQVRARLSQTEDALKDLKAKAGIVSLKDATNTLTEEAAKVEDQLRGADSDIAETQARLRQMTSSTGGVTIVPGYDSPSASPSATGVDGKTNSENNEATSSPTPAPEPPEVIQKYQALSAGLQKLRQVQIDLLSKYTSESETVKTNQSQIDDIDKQLRGLEKKYPGLPAKVHLVGGKPGEMDPASEAAHLAGLKAKRTALAARLKDVQQRIQQLSQVAPQIDDLERQKELQENNYKYFQATLEKARIDEALDPSKIPNISAVQRPSPPVLVTSTRDKIAAGAAIGGLAVTVIFALLKELILSGKVRRPSEVEKSVGISPLMSIPLATISKPKRASTAKRNGQAKAMVPKVASRNNVAPWETGHFIRPYTEAIRDRLGLYFELHNLTHKPKLVGVASLRESAGASTLAAGLAAALSETNDGKVLLVDVSLGPDQVHPFFKGKPAYALNAALKSNGEIDAAAENLYLAKASQNAGPAQLGLKKFFDLMPNMKASDFDYIIFDMPPLEQTSPTWGMAPFMDKMLVVVESEKNSRDSVKRVYRRLLHERDNVSLVLNKVRSYAPKRLELDY
jgi:uncharacterized protein involved in exopolysaccharide biosynthesis/Mrp family chromosome partitioning ATPase